MLYYWRLRLIHGIYIFTLTIFIARPSQTNTLFLVTTQNSNIDRHAKPLFMCVCEKTCILNNDICTQFPGDLFYFFQPKFQMLIEIRNEPLCFLVLAVYIILIKQGFSKNQQFKMLKKSYTSNYNC